MVQFQFLEFPFGDTNQFQILSSMVLRLKTLVPDMSFVWTTILAHF